MSATMRRLEFSIVVEDWDRLTEAQRREVEECDERYCISIDDHVVHLLDSHMRQFGEEFCKAFPQWFRCPLQ